MRVSIYSPNSPEKIIIEARVGEVLASALWLSGKLPPASLCSGLALCGRCKIRFLANPPPPTPRDEKYFSKTDLAKGWRLACAHFAPIEDIELELPAEIAPAAPKIAPVQDDVFLAIDLGTTTIEWIACGQKGEEINRGKFLNPQGGAGADVISRVAAAHAGDKRLASLAKNAIKNILERLESAGARIKRVCVAANSAMTEILLEKDLAGLNSAPWFLSWRGGEILTLNIDSQAREFVFPPLFSPFVGGDAAAALLALKNAPRPFLLADLGTNAEIILAGATLRMASAPLGPALEGVGPALGRLAADNVVASFSIAPGGLKSAPTKITPPAGIAAAGYISLLASLLRLGVMNVEGNFNYAPAPPLAKKIASRLSNVKGEARLSLDDNLYVTAGDIEILLKVKAAFSAVLRAVIGDLPPNSIKNLYFAGALGQHVKADDLVDLGFIPQALGAKIVPSGNLALRGAKLLALDPAELNWLLNESANAEIIDITADEKFFDAYIQSMRWSF